MSKYKYRAIKFQQVDWERVRERAGDERVVVSIDVAKEEFYVMLMRADEQMLETVKWCHPQQTRALVQQLVSLGAERLEAVLEPTGTYGDALRGVLRAAGIAVYRISPKRVHDAAEVFDGVPSLHDAKAAYLIGRLHLQRVSRPWAEPDERRRTLRAQLKGLELGQERYRRALNRLEALLARHWPEAPYCLTLGSASLLHVLACYGDAATVAANAEAAGERLRRIGGRWHDPNKVAQLLDSARTTIGVPCVAAERALVQELAQEALSAREKCREIERRLAQQVRQHPVLAQLAEAVGKTTAVLVYCALGDPRDYPDAASYLKAAGLNLKVRSSGKLKGQLKITKRGPAVVRYYLYFAVLRLIVKAGPAQRWYQAKVARDGGLKGKAITALVRKLAKALWHVGRGAPFDQDKLFGQRPLAPQTTAP